MENEIIIVVEFMPLSIQVNICKMTNIIVNNLANGASCVCVCVCVCVHARAHARGGERGRLRA